MLAQLIKVIGAIGILFVALIISAVAVLKSKDFNEYRQFISEQVRLATGRDLTIDGDLKLILSVQPSIAVEGIHFANAPWGSRPEMASIQRFQAKIKIMPLFLGKIEIVKIILSGVEARIDISKDGRSNLDFLEALDALAASPGLQSFPFPEVHNIEFRDIRLSYADARRGETTSVALDHLIAVSSPLNRSTNVEFAGTVNHREVMARGTVGALEGLFNENKPWPVSLTLSGPGLTAKVDGTIKRPLEATGLDLRIALDVADTAAAAALAGVTVPDLGTVKLSGLVRDTKTGYSLTGMEAAARGSDVSGDVALDLTAARPLLKAALTSRRIKVDEWLGPDREKASGRANADGRIFPADALPLNGLKAADADITLTVKRLTAKKLVMTDIDLKLTLDNGLLNIAPLRAGIADGRIETSINLDSRPVIPVLALKLEGNGLNVGGLLKDMNLTDILSGVMAIKADVKGQGTSVRALMADLDGGVSVVGRNGKLNSKELKNISTGVLDVLPWVGKGDTNTINCIVGWFDIADGKARSRALVLDTNGVIVVGQGTLDLKAEQIDLDVDIEAKNASLAKLALPFNVGGTFAIPTVTPNVGMAVVDVVTGTVGTVGNIVAAPISILGSILGLDNAKTASADDPCLQALSASPGKKVSDWQPAVQPVPPPKQKQDAGIIEGIGNFGKGLTKSLGELFGN